MTGKELFEKLIFRIAKLPETSGLSFEDNLAVAVEVIFLRLWKRRSDIAHGNLNVSMSTTPFALPADFRGFDEDPYLLTSDGLTVRKLYPLPVGGERSLFLTQSFPEYYRVNGFQLNVVPYTEESTFTDLEMLATLEMADILAMEGSTQLLITHSLRGKYYSCPVTGMGLELPWGGIFDHLIADAVIESVKSGGLSSLLANEAFQITLDHALDSVIGSRDRVSPRRAKARFM